MENHIKIIGTLWIAFGVIFLFFALFIFGVLFGVSFIHGVEAEADIILRSIAIGVGIFLAIHGLPELIGSIWLLKKQEWARILVLALAFLMLLAFPIGTALGIYSIVILTKKETVQLFKKKK